MSEKEPIHLDTHLKVLRLLVDAMQGRADAVRAGRLHTPRDQAALEARLGYTIGDIKAAVDAHDLDGKRAARQRRGRARAEQQHRSQPAQETVPPGRRHIRLLSPPRTCGHRARC